MSKNVSGFVDELRLFIPMILASVVGERCASGVSLRAEDGPSESQRGGCRSHLGLRNIGEIVAMIGPYLLPRRNSRFESSKTSQ